MHISGNNASAISSAGGIRRANIAFSSHSGYNTGFQTIKGLPLPGARISLLLYEPDILDRHKVVRGAF